MGNNVGDWLEIQILGSYSVSYNGQTVPELEHARLQELLTFLLLKRGKPVSRQQAAFLFWPNSKEDQARTNLRNLLHRLRRVLPLAEHCLLVTENSI